ncbi:MAG: hypothetical protein IT383_28805 [Deltaproteobacteria bacterium]|nr:hypothetical protein [Deltaproteobacteria bacterium]
MTQNLLILADAVAEGVALDAAPNFHVRGGGAQKTLSLIGKGLTIEAAARDAAKQAKGHAFELMQATQHTARLGAFAVDAVTQPNSVANHPHADLELLEAQLATKEFQLGVGSAAYLGVKIRSSQADAVIVPQDARAALEASDSAAYALCADHLEHAGVSTDAMTNDQIVERTVEDLMRFASSSTRVGVLDQGAIAFGAAAQSAFVTGTVSVMVQVVERLATGKPIDKTIWGPAMGAATKSFLTTGLQTYYSLSTYLAVAQGSFEARVLRQLISNAPVTGAIAEIIIGTAREVVRFHKNEIDLDELLRRTGVVATSAVGSGVGVVIGARVLRGQHPIVQLLGIALFGILGARFGTFVGVELFKPKQLGAGPVTSDVGLVGSADIARPV